MIYNGRHGFPDTHSCGLTFTSVGKNLVVHCIFQQGKEEVAQDQGLQFHAFVEDCEPDSDSDVEECVMLENFNQLKSETTISEEISLQIELETDKKRFLDGPVPCAREDIKEILQADEINTNQFDDNKISQQSFKNISSENRNCEDRSEGEQTADFGISLGKFLDSFTFLITRCSI